MKSVIVVLLFAVSAVAQNSSAVAPAACGSMGVSYDVKVDDSQHAPTQPEPGKARIYVIQDDGPWGSHQHYTLRIGLDGTWVGAYKQNSYVTVSVEPGERHLCANVQSDSSFGKLVELTHFTAEAGKVYYFRTRFLAGMPGPTPPILDLDPVDSDQANHLISSYPLSISRPNK